LFFLFTIAPIIYTSLLCEIVFFNTFTSLVKSVIVLTLWLLPLASGIMILMMRYIDESSLKMLKFLPFSNFVLFKEIVFKQIYFPLLGTFALIFMMTFIQEEVPSFFGYRTYAEEFLSRIILMEKFESTLLYSLPFLLLSFNSSLLFYSLVKKRRWELFEETTAPLDRFDFFNSQKIAYLGVFIFLAISLFILFRLLSKLDYSMLDLLFSENITILFNSFFLSLLASIIATILSIYLVKYFNNFSKIIVLISIASLYWFLPPSLTALVLLKFSQFIFIDSELYSYIILIYGYVLRVLPVGLVIMFILSRHRDLNYLFKLVKISKWHLFFSIVLPIEWRKWFMVFGILFFLVLNEVTTTVLLVPPGFETVIIKIYNLMHYGDFDRVIFLSLLQIAIILIGLSLFALTRGVYDKA
ncbi:MAG: hypothetical protein DRG78_23305, partial [Epsilonproteobacteria bacterium]